MKWYKLKTLDCPQCGKPLTKNLLGYACTACTFKIGNKKFDSVVSSLYKQPSTDAEDEETDRNFDEQAERDQIDLDQSEWGNPGKGENGDWSNQD